MTARPVPTADAAFLAALPVLIRHAEYRFRAIRCPHARADLTQEVLAYGLKWTRLLWARGKDVRDFPHRLAAYAVLAVRNGRRLCGMSASKDVLNPSAGARFGFTSTAITGHEDFADSPLREALLDNTQSAVPEQAAFRIDFPVWLETRAPRDRRIIADMMREERTSDLARRHRVTPARISQLRRAYRAHWRAFHGDTV